MNFDIMNIVDPHKFYYEKHQDTINKINKIIPIKKNDDDKSLFRFYYDDYLVHVLSIDADIIYRTFISINIDMIREGKRKGRDMIFIFKFNDDVFYWKYTDKQIIVGYNYTDSYKLPKNIHVLSKYLNSINIFQ